MQKEQCLPKLLDRGTKRKLFALRSDLLAKRSRWSSRKPSHLTVEKGFLPPDHSYSVKEVQRGDGNLYRLSLENRRFILKDLKRPSSPDNYFVIEESSTVERGGGFFSKFHSVVQVMLTNFHEGYTFRAKPLAMAATDRISNRFDTIFEMIEDDFVQEYKVLKGSFECDIPCVENGLPLELEDGTVKLVKGEELLRRLHWFIENNIPLICPTQRALLTISEHFSGVRNFKLHFDCLYLLVNAELLALEKEGVVAEQYAKSAFDLLYDVWVCCYQKYSQNYKLLHLSTKAWDEHRKGLPLLLTEYNDDIRNCLDKEALAMQAVRAAKHYDFMGLNFVIPERSVFYQKFKRNCINA